MRIIAGTLGGRVIPAARGATYRPTGERVREAIFSSLESLGAVSGSVVADLYAGSGALGIEALSRGAARATFVEANALHARVLRKTLADLQLQDMAAVREADALRVLPELGSFDLLFVDPPWAEHRGDAVVQKILHAGAARAGARIVVESAKGFAMAHEITDLDLRLTAQCQREKTYGDTLVRYYEVVQQESE